MAVRAGRWLQMAEKSASQGKWSAACKMYYESTFDKPTVPALLGMANSHVYMNRQGNEKSIRLSKKRKDFEYASSYFKATLAFDENTETSLNREAISEIKEKISCIDGYLQMVGKESSINCSPVREVLENYRR